MTVVYLKTHSAFETYRSMRETGYDMVLESYDGDTSKIEVEHGAVGLEDIGSWLIVDGGLYLVSAVHPADDRSKATITCREPQAVFDQDVYYTSAAYGTLNTGAFVAAVINAEFVQQADSLYALPRLVVRNYVTTAQIPPSDEPDGTVFNLYDYLTMLRDSYGIFVDMSFSRNTMYADIREREPAHHNIVTNDGHAILDSLDFGDTDTVAKITSIKNGVGTHWYLTASGAITHTPPEPRVKGSWEKLVLGANDDAEQKVREKFGANSGAHKAVFRSDREFALGDAISLRAENNLVEGRISYKARKKSDSWWIYRTGDLAVTLTDKMKRM